MEEASDGSEVSDVLHTTHPDPTVDDLLSHVEKFI